MIEKICFLVNYNLYESKRQFTEKLAAALNRHQVETLVIDLQEKSLDRDTSLEIFQFAPDFTCSFNSISPTSSGKFLWDILNVPHLAILVDPAIYSLELIRSPLCTVSCVDQFDCETLQKEGGEKVFFLPHATEPPEEINRGERPYDVVFIGSCYDYESFETSWKKRYPLEIQQALHAASQRLFSQNDLPLIHALQQTLAEFQITVDQQMLRELFYELDNYTRGYDRVHLIRSIRDTSVQVYGDLMTDDERHQHDWRYYLGDQPNVTVHAGVSFPTALEILSLSKICLNSMPFFKDGSHERVFNSLAYGALPISSKSLYLEKQFVEGEEIGFYSFNERAKINKLLDRYLMNENLRQRGVESGRKKVKQHHSWDARAKQLLDQLTKPANPASTN